MSNVNAGISNDLIRAAKSGNIDDVKNLLDEEGKAQFNATDDSENTPLHFAAENSHKDVVNSIKRRRKC